MAEGQTLSVPSADQHVDLTCALCLDVYREPMLLPCSHTFCLRCLKDLVDKATNDDPQDCKAIKESFPPSVQSDDAVNSASPTEASDRKSFPCPTCRHCVAIPEDGVAAFRINVDINPDDLSNARDDSHCNGHRGKARSMFCIRCDAIICRKCKINHHLHHMSEDIADTAVKAKTELSKEKLRIKGIHDNLLANVNKREKDLSEFEAKKAVVQREILQRYNTIIAAAEKQRNDALAALQTCDDDVGHKLRKELDDVRKNIREAHYLYQRIERAETTGDPCTLVTVSKEMTSGSGSEAAVKKLMAVGHLNQACRPVHQSALPDDDVMFQTMTTFIGKCEVVTLPRVEEQEPGLMGEEEFQCGDHDDVTVFSLKATANKNVYVSFDPFYHNQLPPAKRYQQQQLMFTMLKDKDNKEQFGRKSFTSLDGIISYYHTNRHNGLYCKTIWNNSTFQLEYERNLCFVKSAERVSNKWSKKNLFTIQSKSSRAFDVDQSQQYFVVVEEGEKPATQRKVLLYRRPDTDITVTAVDTYTSPITPFQPADVCFYSLQGKQVLVIADEAIDALQVAKVKDDHVTFTRFLCPGCPLLLQPTALNTDHEGRLWVGCRGGRILTVQSACSQGEGKELRRYREKGQGRYGSGFGRGFGRYGGRGQIYGRVGQRGRGRGGQRGLGREGQRGRGRGGERIEEEKDEEDDMYCGLRSIRMLFDELY